MIKVLIVDDHALMRRGLMEILHREVRAVECGEVGRDLRTIQLLPGHANLRHPVIYRHLSRRHQQAVANPLDTLNVSGPETVYRSRKKHKR